MVEVKTSRSKRYSRDTVDFTREQSSIVDLFFLPIVKRARYKVKINKFSRVLPNRAHNRSFRQQDITKYIMQSNRSDFDGYVRLDDFFDGEISKGRPSVEIAPKIRRVKGLSITVSEGFIDEKKWWRRIFRSRPEDAISMGTSKRGSGRSSWFSKTDIIAHSKRKSGIEPEYMFSRLDVISFLEKVAVNSNRLAIGLGLTRKIFGFRPTQQKSFNRPFFTVYVTLLQMILFFGIIVTHGLAPIGFAFKILKEPVLMPDLNTRLVMHYELQNFWIGPRQADLIKLGAKFSPCIKPEEWFLSMQESFRTMVNESGCCVYKDGSGCIQTAKKHCSISIALWLQGKVCGQDPDYCYDNVPWEKLGIEDWPPCKNKSSVSKNLTSMSGDTHMQCSLVGRPCCLGVLGECIMTTREYCNFKRGVFHQDLHLCSQVDCLQELCGMLPFASKGLPDQNYRLLTSLFIIPGILALVITLLFQWIIMFDLERLTGTLEMTIVYLGCGVGGSIISCLFMPYYVEAGPSGSQFGVIAILAVEVVRWNIQEKPKIQIFTCLMCLVILFFMGLIVPQIDNFAHLSGFVIGIFIAIAFRPIRQISKKQIRPIYVKLQRILGIACSVILIFSFAIMFYTWKEPIACSFCMYLNCLPITDDFCEGMSVDLFYNSILLAYDEW